MYIRACNLCKEPVNVDQRRHVIIRKAMIVGYSGQDKRFYPEHKTHRNDIVVCELCVKKHQMKTLWDMIATFIDGAISE